MCNRNRIVAFLVYYGDYPDEKRDFFLSDSRPETGCRDKTATKTLCLYLKQKLVEDYVAVTTKVNGNVSKIMFFVY